MAAVTASARDWITDAPVLLLDEPTAHVDAETAEELVRDVFDATRGKTVLLVTHRPEGLELAERVFVSPRRAWRNSRCAAEDHSARPS